MSDAIVVFGGAGFIGSHLLGRLAEQSSSKLYAVDKRPPHRAVPGVEYMHGDVRDLSQLSIREQIGQIYNLAAVHTTPGHPDHEYYETNVLGALEVTRFAEANAVPEIVFTSSISVYGPGEDTKTENSPLSPVSAYGHSKRIAERVHLKWCDGETGRRLVIARPAVVFGPGERGNFTRLVGLLKKGFFVYPGRKDTVKACFYIQDLLDAIEFARASAQPTVIFNGAYQQRFTIQEIVETLIKYHFNHARTVMLPRPMVSCATAMLTLSDRFDFGIHSERVRKLMRSTDVYPEWLANHNKSFPEALERAFERWAQATQGRFE